MSFRVVRIAATLIAAAACGGSDGDGYSTGTGNPGGGSTTNSITIRNNTFDPAATTVPVGTTVTWTWAQGVVAHDVTFSDGPASPTQTSGTFPRTFTTAGSYPYHCTQHQGMNGTVTVR